MIQFSVILYSSLLLANVEARLLPEVDTLETSTPLTSSEDVGIVGGEGIDISEAPYQVAFLVNWLHRQLHICGGSIINSNTVITAAHCMNLYRNSRFNYTIRAGSTSKSEGGQLVEVKNVIIHPKFDNKSADYDLALVTVSPPFQFSTKIAAVDMMNAGEEIKDGSMVTVTGWGMLNFPGDKPDNLQMVKIPTVNQESCKNAYRSENLPVTARMTCGGYSEGGKGTCSGDSGGPMIYEGRLAGLVSWGKPCALAGYPDVFSKISAMRSWIDKNINIEGSKMMSNIFN